MRARPTPASPTTSTCWLAASARATARSPDDEKTLHDAIKAKAAEMEKLFAQMPQSAGPAKEYAALGLMNLELAVMWSVKALTS